mmetsp:Transcript_31936/g.95629  ORF Transcript_31936/g.95629 Transcript_31936/m.95629 type:complete len:218 (-) Transcript_31936:459-1112(-)
MKTSETGVATVATLLLVLALDSAEAHASPSACNSGAKSAFIGRRIVDPCRQSEMLALSVRGGARRVYDDEDEYDSDVDEYDSESEEEEERVAMLSKSTRKAAVKVKSKKAAVMKKAVSASLSQTKPKKQKSLLAILHVPYIMRACLNPFTFLAMTKAYFASLFNIDYLAEVCALFSTFRVFSDFANFLTKINIFMVLLVCCDVDNIIAHWNRTLRKR